MVIEWTTDSDTHTAEPPKKRAAEYVRMSTEHQKYSTDNQASEIRAYAARRGFEIVRTYADEGKSGLSVDGRVSLQALLASYVPTRSSASTLTTTIATSKSIGRSVVFIQRSSKT